jgi:hypothetical protein
MLDLVFYGFFKVGTTLKNLDLKHKQLNHYYKKPEQIPKK